MSYAQKNIGAPKIRLIDESGYNASAQLSRAVTISLASTDFAPGFPFMVYVQTAGNITIHPIGNDSTDSGIPPQEAALYVGNITMSVPANTLLPFLVDTVVKATTTATGLIAVR